MNAETNTCEHYKEVVLKEILANQKKGEKHEYRFWIETYSMHI